MLLFLPVSLGFRRFTGDELLALSLFHGLDHHVCLLLDLRIMQYLDIGAPVRLQENPPRQRAAIQVPVRSLSLHQLLEVFDAVGAAALDDAVLLIELLARSSTLLSILIAAGYTRFPPSAGIARRATLVSRATDTAYECRSVNKLVVPATPP